MNKPTSFLAATAALTLAGCAATPDTNNNAFSSSGETCGVMVDVASSSSSSSGAVLIEEVRGLTCGPNITQEQAERAGFTSLAAAIETCATSSQRTASLPLSKVRYRTGGRLLCVIEEVDGLIVGEMSPEAVTHGPCVEQLFSQDLSRSIAPFAVSRAGNKAAGTMANLIQNGSSPMEALETRFGKTIGLKAAGNYSCSVPQQ